MHHALHILDAPEWKPQNLEPSNLEPRNAFVAAFSLRWQWHVFCI